jgi:hypothetical protein
VRAIRGANPFSSRSMAAPSASQAHEERLRRWPEPSSSSRRCDSEPASRRLGDDERSGRRPHRRSPASLRSARIPPVERHGSMSARPRPGPPPFRTLANDRTPGGPEAFDHGSRPTHPPLRAGGGPFAPSAAVRPRNAKGTQGGGPGAGVCPRIGPVHVYGRPLSNQGHTLLLRTPASAFGSCRSPALAAGGCARATGCTCRRSPSASARPRCRGRNASG